MDLFWLACHPSLRELSLSLSLSLSLFISVSLCDSLKTYFELADNLGGQIRVTGQHLRLGLLEILLQHPHRSPRSLLSRRRLSEAHATNPFSSSSQPYGMNCARTHGPTN